MAAGVQEQLAERLEGVVGPQGLTVLGPAGGPNLIVAAPDSEGQAVELVNLARGDGLALLPQGAGTKRDWCHPAERVDFVLSTRRLAGVLSFEPADGTLRARAGTPMAELAELAASEGLHLAPELSRPPGGAGPTIGGAVAAGQSGLDRLRYGSLRDALLGTRVLGPDGEATQSGGQLVKNVTGYDLHRLHAGAHGSLGLILEVSLRLHPAPAAELVLELDFDSRSEALEALGGVLASEAQPVAALAHDLGGADELSLVPLAHERGPRRWTALVVLAGHAQVLEVERAALEALLPGARIHGAEAAAERRARARDLERFAGPWPTLVLSSVPSRLGAALSELESTAREQGVKILSLIHPGLARASVWAWHAEMDGVDTLELDQARALHRRLSAGPARLSWLHAPPALRGEVDLFGQPSPGLDWMRKLKRALDPDGVFPRGRCHGRI